MKKLLIILLTLVSVNLFAQVELVSGGSANNYTLAFPGVFSYSNGISFTFKANFANTGVATINVNSLGAKTIKKHQGADLAANDIKNGQVVTLVYDGTNFQMTSGLGNAPGGGGGGTLAGDVTGDISSNTVEKIRGVNVVATTPTTNQVLQYNGTNWAPATLGGGGGNPAWELGGNSGTDSTTNFIGTTDEQPLLFNTVGTPQLKLTTTGGLEFFTKLAIGVGAMRNATSSGVGTLAIGTNALGNYVPLGDTWNNIAIGDYAMQNLIGSEDRDNTAVGAGALRDFTHGESNTAIGSYSMSATSTGNDNTAIGAYSLFNNNNGNQNTAVGSNALQNNQYGSNQVAIGLATLHNYVGSHSGANIAIGNYALNQYDISGTGDDSNGNIAIGTNSMYEFLGINSDHSQNTAVGDGSMQYIQYSRDNAAFGYGAMRGQIGGSDVLRNSAFGYEALQSVLNGDNNTAMGFYALRGNEDGNDNVALGYNAMAGCTTNVAQNVAVGSGALQNVAVNNLTAVGHNALQNNTNGLGNTALGYSALQGNSNGDNNTAVGNEALVNNQYGHSNVAVGQNALASNTSGENNTALGTGALYSNNSNNNVAVGKNALQNNTTGTFNTALGAGIGSTTNTGNHNAFFGYSALSIGDGSGITILGSQAIAGFNTTQNTTVIGASTFYDGDNAVRLGNSLVTTVEGPVAYTVASDARFKTNVSATDVKGLDFITKLRPVNYNFDTRKYEEFISKNLPDSIRRKRLAQDFTTSTAIRQTGFIAQEVEKAAKETGYDFSSGLHTPKTENGYYTVAYSQFVVPLVKAVQELNAKVEALEKENAALKAEKESNIIGYKATYSKTTPITVDDLQRQINDLKKRIEEQSKTH